MKSWEAHEHNPQFGEIECTDIGKSQRLQTDGNARINKVSAVRPGWQRQLRKEICQHIFEDLKLTFGEDRILARLIILRLGHQNETIHCHEARLRIAVQQIIDLTTRSSSTAELCESA